MKELVDALATNAGFFFVLLAIMWGLQFVLAFYQLRRFNRRIFEVRTVAVPMQSWQSTRQAISFMPNISRGRQSLPDCAPCPI